MYKEDLALNNQKWFTCHKTKLNQPPNHSQQDATQGQFLSEL